MTPPHLFEVLEAELSPRAKHALQAYQMAFGEQADPTITIRELRTAIRRIYGEATDNELERHFEARRNTVLGFSPKPPE